MENILALIGRNTEVIALAAAGISLIALICGIISLIRAGKIMRKYNKLMEGMDETNLEELLTTHLKTVNKVFSRTLEIESEYKATKKMAEKSVQRLGLIRFNAFNDTGSDLSFALAMLDAFGDGFVVSSLFGRDETRIYAKPVEKGQSTYHLSEEEKEAIKKALEQKNY